MADKPTYTYVTLDFPAFGVNDAGQIVGTTNGLPLVGSGSSPYAYGINDAGQIVGTYNGSDGTHGFIYSGGIYTQLDDLLANPVNGTSAFGINATDQIVGSYYANNLYHGFLYSGGIYTTLDDPLATEGTYAFGINATGQIVGIYNGFDGQHGFLYSGGIYTTLDDPLGIGTHAYGINDAGQIVGEYFDGNGGSHGFLYSGGNYTTLDDPLGTVWSYAFGINNLGQIAGEYADTDINGVPAFHGFLATPAPPLNGSPTVTSGQTLSVTSGQTSSGVIVLGGGIVDVLSGGTARGTIVSSGGIEIISSGGIVSNTTVLSGGALDVLSGGLADPTMIDSDGLEVVSAGGTDNGAQISGGEQDVLGLASDATVFTGSQVVESGGTASGTTVSSGGTLDVLSGGIASNTHVLSGGTLVIGGTLSGFTVSSGVTFEVSGGTVSKTTVLSGGTLELLARAKQNGTTISSGGIFEIGAGQTLSGYRVSRGITLEAVLGGTVSNTTVLSGGTFAVLSGGTANGITVSRGGTATIASGAVVSGASKVSATGTSATLVVEGDILTVGSGGVLLGSGAQMDLEVGQVSGTLTIARGATVSALSGASALLASSGKSIANSGLINVGNDTTLTLSGTVINSGTIEVSAASSATALDLENAKISGGKLLTIGSNAVIEAISGTNVIQGVTIVSGSLVEVTSGTQLSLNGGTIGKGATVETASGGTVIVSGTVTNSGTLFASGAKSTIAIIGVVKGGTAEVGDGVVDITKASSEAVTFRSGGTGGLVLDDAIAYTGKLSGFGAGGNASQFIDLTDVNIWSLHPLSYTPANAANTSGTLTVTDGTRSAHIKFVGTYTSASFTAVNDGTGGVKITDPPVIDQHPGNAAATIASDTVLEGKVPYSGQATFAGPTGTLWLDKPSTFTGKVADFAAQDGIDLPGIPFGLHTTLGYSENSSDTGGILSVKEGTHIAKIALLGNYMATSFVATADGHGGTLLTQAPQTGQQPLLAHPQA